MRRYLRNPVSRNWRAIAPTTDWRSHPHAHSHGAGARRYKHSHLSHNLLMPCPYIIFAIAPDRTPTSDRTCTRSHP
ncbi:MAG: hypothetical protein AB4352_12400 [Hormoscilla sp.]